MGISELAAEMAASMSSMRVELEALSREWAAGMKPEMAKELTSGAQVFHSFINFQRNTSFLQNSLQIKLQQPNGIAKCNTKRTRNRVKPPFQGFCGG
jgi:hypothetical protein